jgi:hypothetical protein
MPFAVVQRDGRFARCARNERGFGHGTSLEGDPQERPPQDAAVGGL